MLCWRWKRTQRIIEKEDTRGELIVQLVRHDKRDVLGQKFYNGKKESEKPCLRDLIRDTGAANQKITADALHLNPKMTELIAENNGYFIIGLKKNQKELLADVTQLIFFCEFYKLKQAPKVPNIIALSDRARKIKTQRPIAPKVRNPKKQANKLFRTFGA